MQYLYSLCGEAGFRLQSAEANDLLSRQSLFLTGCSLQKINNSYFLSPLKFSREPIDFRLCRVLYQNETDIGTFMLVCICNYLLQQEGKDSNSDQWFWRPTCYRYTTNLYIVILLTFIISIQSVGFEPTTIDYSSTALPTETYDCSITSEEFTITLRTF